MKALRQVAFGRPSEALRLVRMDVSSPGEGEILCRVLASPLNPADLLGLRGFYPIKPPLPWTPGIEGVGQVVAMGKGVDGFETGQLVLLPIRSGSWAEMAIASANECLLLPDEVCPIQVCMLRINVLTARVLIEEILPLSEGDWLIQNPGSSSVAQYVTRLARRRGIRTCNIIRRPERAGRVTSSGGTVALVDGPDLKKRVENATEGASISLALDATGGGATDRMAACLADNGVIISYGAVSRQAARLGVMHSVFRGVRLQGFWLYPWKRANPERTLAYLEELVEEFRAGQLVTEVAGSFGLDDWEAAFELSSSSEREGRVVLCPSSRL